MAQALRYLAVMQSPEMREVMFKSAEYKCGSCKQPKRGHWCPAEALKEQNRNVLQQLGAIEATHNIPALVLNHKLRRVAMMPPTEIETADDAPPPAQPVAAPACPQVVCKSWFEGGVCTTFWDCLLLHPPAPTLPSIPLSFPGLLQQLGPAPGVGLPPLPPPLDTDPSNLQANARIAAARRATPAAAAAAALPMHPPALTPLQQQLLRGILLLRQQQHPHQQGGGPS